MIAHLNIGSNIGDRLANIRQAVAALERRFGCRAHCSAPFESEPWGYQSANRFINIGINIEAGALSPEAILDIILEIQHSISDAPHRDAAGGYIDRPIDIDFIALADTIVATPRLTLPHPRMHLREFVLRPMAEILPDWKHPLLGATPQEILSLRL